MYKYLIHKYDGRVSVVDSFKNEPATLDQVLDFLTHKRVADANLVLRKKGQKVETIKNRWGPTGLVFEISEEEWLLCMLGKIPEECIS